MATKATATKKTAASKDLTIGEKLDRLYELQSIHTNLDKIDILRGELPMEVADLEDEIVGLETRISNIKGDIDAKKSEIAEKKNGVKESEALITRYKSQLDNVKNNREFDALTKEIELQELEIQLQEKKMSEFTLGIDQSKEVLKETEERLDSLKKNLKEKKVELEKIIKETEKEEASLKRKAAKVEKIIEDRLLTAYNRIRSNYRNGLAVVTVERDSCGGCFGMVPPQMQMDIRQRKKIILCEHCGRVLVAPED
jgi:predicted  nucleic acid-binding Zn-ribbon protein